MKFRRPRRPSLLKGLLLTSLATTAVTAVGAQVASSATDFYYPGCGNGTCYGYMEHDSLTYLQNHKLVSLSWGENVSKNGAYICAGTLQTGETCGTSNTVSKSLCGCIQRQVSFRNGSHSLGINARAHVNTP